MNNRNLLLIFSLSFTTLNFTSYTYAQSAVSNESEKNNSLSIIFENEPKKWGFRGDPWFWRHLKKLFENYNETISEYKLEQIIKDEHRNLTGENLSTSSWAYCKKFDHGGMSHGGLNGAFWINTGIPLLKARLKDLKRQDLKS